MCVIILFFRYKGWEKYVENENNGWECSSSLYFLCFYRISSYLFNNIKFNDGWICWLVVGWR